MQVINGDMNQGKFDAIQGKIAILELSKALGEEYSEIELQKLKEQIEYDEEEDD